MTRSDEYNPNDADQRLAAYLAHHGVGGTVFGKERCADMGERPVEDASLNEAVKCNACGATLAVSVAHKSHMVIPHSGIRIYRAQIECAECGTWQFWHSRPASAVRLGIPE